MADENVRFRVSTESDLSKLLTDLDSLIRKQNDLGDENSRAVKAMNSNLENHAKQYTSLGNSISGVKNMLMMAFGIDQVKEAIIKVFDLTATYQKYTAALSVGLGSQKKAAEALDMLQGYADKTNFTLDELADTFTKLANRGLVVSREEMVKLGDVANTLQKPFGDLVEAILDVNNTERWNELGIKAKTAGDKVQLTFKGVTLEVDRTEKGVLSAITTFGTLNGVQGATAAQALTLSGRLSTLEDSASGLGRTVGKAMTPAFEEAIDAAGGMIKVIAGSNSAFDRTVNYVKAAAAALTTFQIVTNAAEIKTIALSAAMAAKEVVMKSYQIVVGTSQIAMQALSSSMGANITITTAATTAARSFWAALAANPIGLIVTAVGLATSAYYAWKGAHAEVNVEIDAATEKLIREKVELTAAVQAVQAYSIGTQERNKAVQELMNKYPDLLGYIDADKVSNLELNKALAQQINLLDAKIRYTAAAAQADVVKKEQQAIYSKQTAIIIKLRGAYKELSEAYPDNDKFVAALKRKQEAEHSNAESMRNMSTAAMAASGSIVAYSGETAKYTELGKQATAMQANLALATIEVSKASAASTNAQVADIERQLVSLDAAHKAKKITDDKYKADRQELLDRIKVLNQEEVDNELAKNPPKKEAREKDKEHAFFTANEIAVLVKETQAKSLQDKLDLIDANMKLEIERINTHKVDYVKNEEDAALAIEAVTIKANQAKEKLIEDSRVKITAGQIEFVRQSVEIETDLSLNVQASEVQRLLNTQQTEKEKQKAKADTLEAVLKINEEEQKVIEKTAEIETKSHNERLKAVLGFIGSMNSALGDFSNFAIKMVDDLDLISGKTVTIYENQVKNAIAYSDTIKAMYGEHSTQYAESSLKVAESKQNLAEAEGASSMASLNMVMMVADIMQKVASAINDMLVETNTAIIEAYDTLANVMGDYYDTLIEVNKTSLDTQLEDFKGNYAEREKIIDEHYAKQTEYAEAKELIEYQAAYTKLTLENDSKMKSDMMASASKQMGQIVANMYEQQALEEEYRIKKLQREIETAEEVKNRKIQALEDELDAYVAAKEEEIKKAEDARDAQIDSIKNQLDAAKDAYEQQTNAVKSAYDEQLSALKEKESQEKAALQATYDFKQQLLEQSKADETEAIVVVDRLRNEALERYRVAEVNRLTATRNRILATLTDEAEREAVTNAYAKKIEDVHTEVENAKLDKSKGVSLATKQLNQEAKDGAVTLKEQEKTEIGKLEDEYQTKFTNLAKDRDAKLEEFKNDYIKRENDLKATIAQLQTETAAIIKRLEDEITAKKQDASMQKANAEKDYANFVLQANSQIMQSQIQMAIAQVRAEIAILQGKRNIFNRGKIDAAVGDLEGSIRDLEALMGGREVIINAPDDWTSGIKNEFIAQRKASRTPFNADTLDAVSEAFDDKGNKMDLAYTDEDRQFTAYNSSGGSFTVRNATGYVAATGKKYFEGTAWVDGMGYPDGRDTVPAMVNKGERILSTDLNELLGGAALSNEKLVEGYLALDKLKQKFGSVRIEEFGRLNFDLAGGRMGTQVDLKGLEKEVKNLTDVIRSKPELKINVDANRMSIAEVSHNQQHVAYYENLYKR